MTAGGGRSIPLLKWVATGRFLFHGLVTGLTPSHMWVLVGFREFLLLLTTTNEQQKTRNWELLCRGHLGDLETDVGGHDQVSL